MANFPNITQAEMATIGAAVLFLFVGPALLSWGDERRRRRAQRAAILVQSQGVPLAAGWEMPVPDTVSGEAKLPGALQPFETEIQPGFDVSAMGPAVAEPPSPPDGVLVNPPPTALQTDRIPTDSAPTPPAVELQPLSGTAHHHFQLDHLHRAQLPDWPPAVIRTDPERIRLRQEAEQDAALYEARVNAASIGAPYPARSYCLGAADADASELRLSFLLFPVVWPVSQNQAVAQAVFRIDRITGEIRGWVDALRSQELSDENRREIREAGGEA
jgi:hypothetical protein